MNVNAAVKDSNGRTGMVVAIESDDTVTVNWGSAGTETGVSVSSLTQLNI